jgi:hypothetical protein
MTFRKQTTRKAGRAAKVKTSRTHDNTPKGKAAKESKSGDNIKPSGMTTLTAMMVQQMMLKNRGPVA